MKAFRVFLLFFSLVVLVSCEKENTKVKYVGNWDFRVSRSTFDMGDSAASSYDTLSYAGTISQGSSAKELLIEYTATNSILLTVNEEGDLSDFPTAYCSGKFNGEQEIDLYLRWGGMGGGTTHIVKGEKK